LQVRLSKDFPKTNFKLSVCLQAKARVDDIKEKEAIHYVDGPETKDQEKRELPKIEEVIKIEEVKTEVKPGEKYNFDCLLKCVENQRTFLSDP
jgi:hypothetical protein